MILYVMLKTLIIQLYPLVLNFLWTSYGREISDYLLKYRSGCQSRVEGRRGEVLLLFGVVLLLDGSNLLSGELGFRLVFSKGCILCSFPIAFPE